MGKCNNRRSSFVCLICLSVSHWLALEISHWGWFDLNGLLLWKLTLIHLTCLLLCYREWTNYGSIKLLVLLQMLQQLFLFLNTARHFGILQLIVILLQLSLLLLDYTDTCLTARLQLILSFEPLLILFGLHFLLWPNELVVDELLNFFLVFLTDNSLLHFISKISLRSNMVCHLIPCL